MDIFRILIIIIAYLIPFFEYLNIIIEYLIVKSLLHQISLIRAFVAFLIFNSKKSSTSNFYYSHIRGIFNIK